jgi:hypothetical protein
MHAYHLNFVTLDNEFSNFTGEISNGIYQMEGHLEMAKIEIAFENFSPMRNFNLGRLPM